jgi:hypothetical protein
MKSAKKSKIMEKSDSDLDEFDDDMSYEEVNDDSEVEEEVDEEEENGNDGGGFSAGTISEAEESSRIKDRYTGSIIFTQHTLFILRREHSSSTP